MKLAPALVAFLMLGTALSGCSSDGNSNESTTGANTQSDTDQESRTLSPIFYDVSVLQDKTIEISLSRPLIVNVEDPEDWTEGGVSDESVAQYEPGFVDNNAAFNPAFFGVSTGTVTATMTNSSSGETVTFTLEVNHEIINDVHDPLAGDPPSVELPPEDPADEAAEGEAQ